MNVYLPSHSLIERHGRHFITGPKGETFLSGSASSLKFRFKGAKCQIWLKNLAPPGQQQFISWVLDGVHSGRKAVTFTSYDTILIQAETKSDFHEIEIFKETESSCGFLAFEKIETHELLPLPVNKKHKIEFIGNSITAGMSADPSLIPCGEGGPCDQHNAYESYGAITARSFNLDFMISAVSGIGVYRNSASDEPVMKDLYESTSLMGNHGDPHWDFTSFIPDIVCINLGTNDFSDGGGYIERQPFDSTLFITSYLQLLELVNKHYPDVKFVLLQHPMSGPHNMKIFRSCLDSVQKEFLKNHREKTVEIFSFSHTGAGGCGGHPDLEDHRILASELKPVVSQLLSSSK